MGIFLQFMHKDHVQIIISLLFCPEFQYVFQFIYILSLLNSIFKKCEGFMLFSQNSQSIITAQSTRLLKKSKLQFTKRQKTQITIQQCIEHIMQQRSSRQCLYPKILTRCQSKNNENSSHSSCIICNNYIQDIRMSIAKDLLRISPEVLNALKQHRAVVALESTIISHGMPYPHNKQCALEVESVVRKAGAVPATIALMHGQIRVGLSEADIEELAQSKNARKVSRRDIPFALAQGELGSTTVAGTMVCSALAGIDVFVTGGLGGVHRDYSETMDVSADLRELGRTPVAVVSAGVKNILDIPRTLEYLETEGVPVITYGSKFFPGFFSPSSGIQSPFSLDSLPEIAKVLAVRKRLNLQNGVLVGVPAQESADGAVIEAAINRALKQAHEQGIRGAATTPFLLKKVHEYSGGVSITANINLVKRNAAVGSELALHLSNLCKDSSPTIFSFYNKKTEESPVQENKVGRKGKVIVLGGSAVDFEVKVTDGKFELYQSCKGVWRTSYGGVGRNIAEVCSRLGVPTTFVTALGGDSTSTDLRNHILSYGIDLCQIRDEALKAPTYLGVMDDNKDAIIGISDMQVNNGLTFDRIYDHFFREEEKNGINPDDIVVVDANVVDDEGNLLKLLQYLNEKGYFVIYECKGTKAIKVATDGAYRYMSLLKMNDRERDLVIRTLIETGVQVNSSNQYSWFSQNVGSLKKNHNYTSVNTIITNGEEKIRIISSNGEVKELAPVKSNCVVKTTGAGDTLTGAICALLLRGYALEDALKLGTIASKMTVESESKISPVSLELSLETLSKEYEKYRADLVV